MDGRSITIDHDGEAPAYKQIADGFRGLIARGRLMPGDALPSVRQLGRQLGVNLNTVAKAYRMLADEGWVELRQGSPARVTDGGSRGEPATLDNEATQTLHRLIDRWVLHGADRKRIERLLATAVTEYFKAARAAKGGIR